MKISKIITTIVWLMFVSFLMISCDKDEDLINIIPVIELDASQIDVDYTAGSTIVPVSSNVVYYANVISGNSWLSYRFSDTLKTFSISYTENKGEERIGAVQLSKGEETVILTIIQSANPFKDGPIDTEINFTIENSNGVDLVMISSEENAKIPVGSTVVFECEGEGTISGAFTGFPSVEAVVVNGKAIITWTEEIASAAAGEQGFIAILFPAEDQVLEVTRVYIPAEILTPEPVEIEFNIVHSNGVDMVMISPEESANIPVGSVLIFECEGVGSLNGAFTGFPSIDVAVEDEEVAIMWTEEIAAAAAGESGFIILLFPEEDQTLMVTRIYIPAETPAPEPTDIDFELGSANDGMFVTILISPEESAKIPVGSTVVIECEGEGIISGTYSGFPSVDEEVEAGKVEFIWSEEIAEAASGESGFIVLIMEGEVTVLRIYFH